MEYKFFDSQIEVKESETEGKGLVRGYGSIFGNVDSYGDIVMQGAFIESLKGRMPKMLYQHNQNEVIGVWKKAYEDSKGLYLEGEINLNVSKGKDAYELLKQGAIEGLSIGFRTKGYEDDYDNETRKLTSVELFEVSLVTFPANEKANVTDVRSIMDNERNFERFLRDAGLSRTQAKKAVESVKQNGFNWQRDAAEGLCDADEAMVKTLTETLNILKGGLSHGNEGTSRGSE